MKTIHRTSLRAVLAAGATAGLLAAGAGAASAHVHVTPEDNAAGGSSVLTFAFAHGCEGSPTSKIAISLPDQLVDATPTVHPGWDVEKVSETLDTPKTLDSGATVTERVSQIVYTAKEPVADGLRDTLQLQVLLPESAGETLAFPVLQTCGEGRDQLGRIPARARTRMTEVPGPLVRDRRSRHRQPRRARRRCLRRCAGGRGLGHRSIGLPERRAPMRRRWQAGPDSAPAYLAWRPASPPWPGRARRADP